MRAIASHRGVHMPDFFGFMLLASAVLLPVLLLVGWLFLRVAPPRAAPPFAPPAAPLRPRIAGRLSFRAPSAKRGAASQREPHDDLSGCHRSAGGAPPASAFARCWPGPASCRCPARITAWRRCRRRPPGSPRCTCQARR
ncbi:MAG: sodium:proton antiporter [Acetobacteraceae bacterium]